VKVLIVDDEALARERLVRLVEAIPDMRVVGEAAEGRQALLQVERLQPEVLLLDIRMPGMDGLEAARHLAALSQPPAVIFTTAYSDHALEAFETSAVGYLLKPIRAEKLAVALVNAQRITRAQLPEVDDQEPRRSQICIRRRGNLELVPVKDIRFFRADHKYVTVRTGEDDYLIEESLKSLEEEFAMDFLRIHRNALVARRFIRGVEKDAEGRAVVLLAGVGERLEISRRHLAAVKMLLTGAARDDSG